MIKSVVQSVVKPVVGSVINPFNGVESSPLNLVKSGPCQFWHDGKDTSVFSLNGNKVIEWGCKGLLAAHVSNAVDAQRPVYDVATGGVIFTAVNSTYLQSAAFGPLAQPNTIYILYKIIGGLADNETVFDAVTNIKQMFYFSTSNFRIYAGFSVADGATNANDNIHAGEFNGAPSNYWINGILVGGPGNTGVGNLDGITLGARGGLSLFADVEIMEVFGYNCVLTIPEHSKCFDYINNKWSLGLTNPW